MNLKHKLALQLCELRGLPKSRFDGIYLEMWHNYQENGGYRLTNTGFCWIRELGMKPYAIKIKDNIPITGAILLGLDRHLRVPYHFKGRTLQVFDENLSTLLILYDGDLSAFIQANA